MGFLFLTSLLCRVSPGGFPFSLTSPVLLPDDIPSICGLYFSDQSPVCGSGEAQVVSD